ncbi:porphobilinogen synthase [candidate division BRC1 bacterium HGW-BRC1-1]|jgi:porphobilinogen synthase|nr:MAG: porphobilinogen synthase [candidate division BRC1 bacterium HGW-BRC1-1]
MNQPHRNRRLRTCPALRTLARETRLTTDCLIAPLFVVEGTNVRREISSLPGVFNLSVDKATEEARLLFDLGIPAVLLFGVPEHRDATGTSSASPQAPVQRAIAAIRAAAPDMAVITDVCLCEYTDHGHCGILRGDATIDNDATIEVLARAAVSHADAGAHMVAPSDMMDLRVAAIRRALDAAGHTELPIMSYAAKYASCFYGPFRDAAQSAPAFGDRLSHQMDPANAREALREILTDIDEGADAIIIKPALPALDIIRTVRDQTLLPIAGYNVSGEYAMVKAAAARGWIDGERAMIETLTAIRRAGADLIITYFAREYASLRQR